VLLFGVRQLNNNNELVESGPIFHSMIFQGFSKQWPTGNPACLCFQALLNRVTNGSGALARLATLIDGIVNPRQNVLKCKGLLNIFPFVC
jgi:hypothetical protein